MLVLKLELHSAITHEISEIGRAIIYNDETGTNEIGNYKAVILEPGNQDMSLDSRLDAPYHGEVKGYYRAEPNVWKLIKQALVSCIKD